MNKMEPYKLTEVQLAYMLGRSNNIFLGGNSTHFYVELDLACNIEKLEEAFNKVIKEQAMLRTVILDDGMQQEYDGDTTYKIEVTNLVGKREEEIEKMMEEYRSVAAQRIFPLNSWPMFAVQAYCIGETKYRLAMDFDMMVMDRFSIDLLMYRIYFYYNNPNAETYVPKVDFRGYIEKKEKYKEENYQEDKNFWDSILDSLPGAPVISYNHNVGVGGRFVYKEKILDSNWQKQKDWLFEKRVVPSVYVLVCYAKMLSIWSNQQKLTINMTTAKRNIGTEIFADVIGDFTQLMLIDFDFSKQYQSVTEEILMCCKETQKKLRKYLKYDSYGGIEVMKEYAKRHNLESGDGFLYAFTSRIVDQETESFDGFILNKGYQISQTPQLLVDCQISELDGKLYLRWDYVEEGIEPENINDMFEAFCQYVEKCTNEETTSIAYGEIEGVVERYNHTSEEIEQTTLQTLFYRQQKRTPDAIAVVAGEESITYAMLQEKSSRVADELISKYGRGKAVAVVDKRSCETIINMLGVLKSGGYYIPISTDIPEERKSYILQASEAVAVLEPGFCSELDERTITEEAYVGIGTPEDIAYVIYTSGSTGTPKGVVINQKSVCNTIIDINQKVNMGTDDCIIGISSFVFDLSVYDIFGALSTGAKLVLAQSALDVDNLIEIIDTHKVTFWNTVPAIMELLTSGLEGRKITSMKHVLLSGDWIPLDLPDKVKDIFTETKVISLGGATEGSIWSIYYPIGERQKNWKSIPYGYPLANQNMYVLNYEDKNCPYDVQGEICIGGIGVAKEYQAAPELTAKSFVMHDTYGYIYHTGDYGVFKREGYIEFLGRKDTQTKIHGFRVELGEIEEVLKKVDSVKESVAQVVTSTSGVQRLLGYVVTSTGETLSEEQRACIYTTLEANLPHYMIPSEVYVIDSVPLTSNGKVNKKALPVFADHVNDIEIKEASTETEKMVVNIVAEILGIDSPGINQDLFELGIDSMKCIQMLSAFKERGYKVSLSELYEQSNLEKLAKLLEEKKDSVLVEDKAFQIAPEDKWEPFRMTPLQEAYYVGRMQQKDKNALPTGGYIEVECKPYCHEKFEFCMQKLIAKHEMLRCKFSDGGIQQFMETVPYFDIPFTDVRDMVDKDAKLAEIRKRVSSSRLDLANPPLIAVEATLIEKETAVIHIFLDGMIMDGWATELFVAELNSLYYEDRYLYEPVEVTFRDYVQYLNYKRETEEYKKDQKYWENRIIDFPESVSLPMLVEPETVETMHSDQIPCSLGMDEWKLLEQKAAVYRVTPFAVLFTSFVYVMSTWNYKKKFLLNIPEFDVPDFHKDYSKVIGLCSSFLLFSAEISWENSFADNVRAVQKQLLELKQHSNYSGMDVIRSISRMQGGNTQGAVCPYVFGMVMEAGNISRNESDEKDCLKLLYQENHTSNIWIDINTIKYDDKVAFNWNYIKELFEASMLQDMVNRQMSILHKAAGDEEYWEQPIAYEMPQSQKELIDFANNQEESYKHKSMAFTIKDSCSRFADREFICTREGSYTYKEIYEKCCRVAGQLTQAGCKKGDHIAVHMGKSMEQLVAIFAITYMGGVYVPLEYSYPVELVTKCYNNTDCVCMVVDYDKAEGWNDDINVLVPDLECDEYILEKPVKVSLDDEFVIIHTSGSTGVPKAVVINQRGLMNSLLFTNKCFRVTKNDRAIALTNIAHDMSMYDIFGMVLVGGGIVVPLERDAKNPLEWVFLIEKYHVTIWNSVPAMQEMLQKVIDEKDIARLQSIRLFIHGGDYLKLPVAKWLYENHKNAKIINVGGPTETTLWNIYHEVTQEDIQNGIIPYGRPIANTKYYLLNENKQQVPMGVVGMMYCAGVGVTKGYYGNDKLTQEKYVFNDITGERMYCTGDMGKYDGNGNIIFMGRIDNQVKINGKRIELNGIASVIKEKEFVKECNVFEKDKEIVAFYTSNKDNVEAELRTFVSEQMPLYMMPKYFVHVPEMIYMPNGKVNKNAMLALVADTREVSQSTDEEYSAIEKKILDLYREQLGEEIDLDTDFYMLGGNSLMLLSMIGELKDTFGIEFDLSEIFGISTPREMAEYLESLM